MSIVLINKKERDENDKYIRLAYSGISYEKINEGMNKLKEYINQK